METLIQSVLAKYQSENRANLAQWIKHGVPLKLERWANGKYYLGPDAEWSTCMNMMEVKLTDPVIKLFNLEIGKGA